MGLQIDNHSRMFTTKAIRDYSKANYDAINAELQVFYNTYTQLFHQRSVNAIGPCLELN